MNHIFFFIQLNSTQMRRAPILEALCEVKGINTVSALKDLIVLWIILLKIQFKIYDIIYN